MFIIEYLKDDLGPLFFTIMLKGICILAPIMLIVSIVWKIMGANFGVIQTVVLILSIVFTILFTIVVPYLWVNTDVLRQ